MSNDDHYPRDIRIDQQYEDEYEKFVTRSSSPFEGVEKSDLYVLAAALGWYEAVPEQSQSRYVLFARSAISDEQMWTLKSIAIAHSNNGVDILSDGSQTIRLIEHYANGGMRLLVNWRDGPEDLVREVTNRMIKASQELESFTY